MLSRRIRTLIHTWGWDTGCRNSDVARRIKPLVSDGAYVLDAGCGENGLASFLPGKNVVGVDVLKPGDQQHNFTFLRGSILSLPFSARSFAVVASVDALEHLPADLRPAAITEMLRVADATVVVSFPSGNAARRVDEAFHRNLIQRNMPVPDWVNEHLADNYPEVESVVAEVHGQATKLGREVDTSVFYSEHIEVTKFLRWAAVRSKYVYIISNFFLGIVLPVFLRAGVDNSYRSILVVRLRKV